MKSNKNTGVNAGGPCLLADSGALGTVLQLFPKTRFGLGLPTCPRKLAVRSADS